MGTLKNYYTKSFEIIKSHKIVIYLVAALELASLIMGIFYYTSSYHGFESIEEKEVYYQAMKEINFSGNFFVDFSNIFTHNLIANLFRIFSGIIFGIIPILLIIDNAVSNSYAIVSSAIDEGIATTMLLYLPHSILEIPAFILSSAFGLVIFLSLFKKGKKIDNLKNAFKESLIIFLLWIVPLLLLAGVIESIIIVTYWF